MRKPFKARGDLLVARLSADELGFPIERVWNPSPTMDHSTEPWPVPKALSMGMRLTPDSGSRFSPPPFAVVAMGAGRRALIHVRAEPGFHLWNEVVFDVDSSGVTVSIDLEGHTRPEDCLGHVELCVTPGQDGEPLHDLLARGLEACYPAAYALPERPAPDWWRWPIYVGWGDQSTTLMMLEGPRPMAQALAYSTQGLYERWVRRLESAGVPIGTVTLDAGWSQAGSLRPNLDAWPDLRGFIRRQHDAGRKVLLWLATWLWDGLPDEWCLFCGDVKLTADPTHPDYRRFLRERVSELISPAGFDADGFKIDQLSHCPSERHPSGGAQFGRADVCTPSATPMRPASPGWGCELMYQLQRDIYDAAKAAKPDSLITSSTVHPYFHNTLDMVRLHDMGELTPNVFEVMQARARLAQAALPHKLIDADDWVHTDYDLWLRYTMGSPTIGVPCLFYAEQFLLGWETEPLTRPIPIEDLKRIAKAWGADA